MTTNGLICMSHLRWDFVFQRPQHLMSRWAKHTRVYYFEEPIRDGARCRLDSRYPGQRPAGDCPHLPTAMSPAACQVALMQMIDEVVERESLKDFVLWYYTPMALPFTSHLRPAQWSTTAWTNSRPFGEHRLRWSNSRGSSWSGPTWSRLEVRVSIILNNA